MEEEMIAHKLKMREESIALDADKRIAEAEQKATKAKVDGIAKAKDVEPVSYADAHPKLNACSNGTFGDHLIECSMKAAGAKQY